MTVNLTDPNPDLRHCDGCGETLSGDYRQYLCPSLNDWLLCKRCQAENECERCGAIAELHTFEWDTPGTWDEPPDNGQIAVCGTCLDGLRRRRTA